ENGHRESFEDDLRALEGDLQERFGLAQAWLEAFVRESDDEAVKALAPVLTEAVMLLLTGPADRDVSGALSSLEVAGLLGQHPRLQQGTLHLRLDELLSRLRLFMGQHVPGYRRFKEVRQAVIDEARVRLRLEEYRPRVLSSF